MSEVSWADVRAQVVAGRSVERAEGGVRERERGGEGDRLRDERERPSASSPPRLEPKSRGM